MGGDTENQCVTRILASGCGSRASTPGAIGRELQEKVPEVSSSKRRLPACGPVTPALSGNRPGPGVGVYVDRCVGTRVGALTGAIPSARLKHRLAAGPSPERAALLHGLRESLFDAIRSQTHFLGLEHLAVMPSEILGRWPVSPTRRSPHEFSIESPQRFRETLTTGVSGHTNPEIVQHRKDPKIEQPVVKCAESEPIGNFGRPRGSMPFDVSGIKRDRHIFYANGKLAHCALAVVGIQYRFAERGVASAAAVLHEGVGLPRLIGKVALFRILWVECANFDPCRSKDVIMKRIGKVCRSE